MKETTPRLNFTDKTTVSISLGVLAIVIGGIYWITEMAFTAKANANRIDDLVTLRRTELSIIRNDIKKVSDLVNEIDGKIDVLLIQEKNKNKD